MITNLELERLFGAGATQTAATLTISKADLTGLTAAADNRAEQLLVAILARCLLAWEGALTVQGLPLSGSDRPVTYKQPRDFYQKLWLFSWERKLRPGKQVDFLVLNVFTSPSQPNLPLEPNSLIYD